MSPAIGAGERAIVGRVLAVGILVVILAAVWLGPVTLYLDALAAGADRLDRDRQTLARYRALTAAPLAGATVPASAAGTLLLPAIPDAQAAAVLQEGVKGAAAAAQVQVQGLQVLQPSPLPGAVKIGVRIRATGDIASLNRLLYAIEAARPLLYPDNLQIQSSTKPLEFQIDVSGFKTGPST